MEQEADRLGLRYHMYKAGYDTTAFVDFFERIQTLEKKKPGTISKIYSHPPTDDRIKRAQKEIQEDLKSQPEYVLDTSESHDVRNRLAMLEHRVKNQPEDPNRHFAAPHRPGRSKRQDQR